MDPNVAIFTATGIAFAGRMVSQGVDWPEVALDSSKLLFEGHVEEPGVELAHPGAGGGDLHGLLATPQHNVGVGLQGGDGRRIHRPFGFVDPERLEGLQVPNAGRGVFAGGDQHEAFGVDLKIVDLIAMLSSGVQLEMKKRSLI